MAETGLNNLWVVKEPISGGKQINQYLILYRKTKSSKPKLVHSKTTNVTEQEIIQGCRKQHRIAQQALYEKYSPKMFGVCKRYLRNHEDAEDVLVEGLFKAMSKIDMFKGAGSFEGWIRRIVVNEALMHLRKNNGSSLEGVSF